MLLPNTLSFKIAQVAKIHRTHTGQLLSRFGLHPGQEVVLQFLWQQDGISQTELARRMQVQSPTVTKMLSRMKESGLLDRRPCKKDKRITRVYLTEKGRSLQGDIETLWKDLENRTLRGFNSVEQHLFLSFLERVDRNLLHS